MLGHMPRDTVEALIESRRGYVVAAAGCGKTEAIAKAIADGPGGRRLVLTHTHAGVKALRDRLKKYEVAESRFRVDTIAGWALRYSANYPRLSGLRDLKPTGRHWTEVYSAALRVLESGAVRDVISGTYSRILVDEYQDCTQSQHELILVLAGILPCCILGDPLQGIFDFHEPVVDWAQQVQPTFDALPSLNTPWRWSDNRALGERLVEVRESLIDGHEVDLRTPPFRWVSLPGDPDAQPAVQARVCLDTVGLRGSILALRKWARNCHALAPRLMGRFTCMEEMDCSDLLRWASDIDAGVGANRSRLVVEFACECMSGLRTPLRTVITALNEGRLPLPARLGISRAVAEAVCSMASTDSLVPVRTLLDEIGRLPGCTVYRRELWREMRRAVELRLSGLGSSLRDAAWEMRNHLRHQGRVIEPRTLSRPLLVKGLEFDHTIVLDAADHDAKDLYVAMTRPIASLTVCSVNPVVHFPALPGCDL